MKSLIIRYRAVSAFAFAALLLVGLTNGAFATTRSHGPGSAVVTGTTTTGTTTTGTTTTGTTTTGTTTTGTTTTTTSTSTTTSTTTGNGACAALLSARAMFNTRIDRAEAAIQSAIGSLAGPIIARLEATRAAANARFAVLLGALGCGNAF